jgi:hypothetical protein
MYCRSDVPIETNSFSRIGLFLAPNVLVNIFPACQLCKMWLLEFISSLKAFCKRGISRLTLMEGTQNQGKVWGEEGNFNCGKLQCSWKETFSFSAFPFVLGVNEGFSDLPELLRSVGSIRSICNLDAGTRTRTVNHLVLWDLALASWLLQGRNNTSFRVWVWNRTSNK